MWAELGCLDTGNPNFMLLTFNRFLDVEGISPDRVQLVRHQDTRSDALTSPYALWVNRDPGFDLYQSIQHRQVFRLDQGSLIASFVVTPAPAAETLFIGLYGVHGIGVAAPGTPDPVAGHDIGGLHLYDLRPDPRLSDYVGKVVIDWGAGFRSWVQRAHKQDKAVLEVRREFREQHFPGSDINGGEGPMDLKQVRDSQDEISHRQTIVKMLDGLAS